MYGISLVISNRRSAPNFVISLMPCFCLRPSSLSQKPRRRLPRWGEVHLLVLTVSEQHIDWRIVAMPVTDHARATALSLAFSSEPNFPDATSLGDFTSGLRIGGKEIDQILARL